MKHLMVIDLRGALANGGSSLKGFTDKKGRPMPPELVRWEMNQRIERGENYMPLGDCDNFDPVKGECLGHGSEEE